MGHHFSAQVGWFSGEQHFSAPNNTVYLDTPAIALFKATLPCRIGGELYVGLDRGEVPGEVVIGQVLKTARSVELHGYCGSR